MFGRTWPSKVGGRPRPKTDAPARPKIKRPEQAFHLAVARYLDAILRPGVMWKHVPNGGKRSPIEAAILKVMGVRAGWPDIEIIWERRMSQFIGPPVFGVVEIELKAGGGTLNAAQRALHPVLRAAGFPVYVCETLDEIRAALDAQGVPYRPHTMMPTGGYVVPPAR